MPTATCLPQANGFWQEQVSVVGAASAWEALVSHDSDSSYVVMTATAEQPTPRLSVIFHGTSNLKPAPLRIIATAKETEADILLALGVSRQSPTADTPEIAIVGGAQAVTGAYTELSLSFAIHPFTLGDWHAGDLTGWEALAQVSKSALSSYPVSLRLTALRVEIDYDEPTHYMVR